MSDRTRSTQKKKRKPSRSRSREKQAKSRSRSKSPDESHASSKKPAKKWRNRTKPTEKDHQKMAIALRAQADACDEKVQALLEKAKRFRDQAREHEGLLKDDVQPFDAEFEAHLKRLRITFFGKKTTMKRL